MANSIDEHDDGDDQTQKKEKSRKPGSTHSSLYSAWLLPYYPARSQCSDFTRYRISATAIKGLAVSSQAHRCAEEERTDRSRTTQTNPHAENSITALLHRRSNIRADRRASAIRQCASQDPVITPKALPCLLTEVIRVLSVGTRACDRLHGMYKPGGQLLLHPGQQSIAGIPHSGG